MSASKQNYSVREFAKVRSLVTDPLDAAQKKNIVCAGFDLDISRFRNESKEKGVGFFSRMVYAVSRTVEKNPDFNSYRKGNSRLVVFKEVDICLMVEKDTGEEKLPLPYILRNANNKSLEEIDSELKIAREGDLHEIYLHKHMKLYIHTPKFLRKLFWHFILKNPFEFQKRLGTVAITALHGKGVKNFHFSPLSPYTLTMAFGSINKDENGREIMKTTMCMDHDIVDGMEVMQFIRTLSEC